MFRARSLERALPLIVLGVFAAIAPAVGTSAAPGHWLWAASLLALGMAHGCFDLAAMHRSTKRTASTALRFAIYTAVTLGSIGVFVLAPMLAVGSFFLIAMHHFGINDARFIVRGSPRSLWDHATGFAHGVIPIAVPFLRFPEEAWAPFAAIIGTTGANGAVPSEVLSLIATIFVVLAGGVLVGKLRELFMQGRGQAALSEAAVLVFAAAIGLIAHPLFAVAAYFIAVHALGHCLAVSEGDPDGRCVRRLARVHALSLPLLIPSLAAVAISATLFDAGIVESLALAFLLFCVVATLPHHLLWLQLRAGHGRMTGR